MAENWKENIYERDEALDMMYLSDFAGGWRDMFATQPFETPYGCQADAFTINHTGGTVAIETKSRKGEFNGFTYKGYDDIYIEDGKYRYLLSLWTNYGVPALFINFFNDGQDALVYNIPALMKDRMKYYPKGWYNPDTGRWEARYGIPITDGIWYRKAKEGWVRVHNAENQMKMGYASECHGENIAYLLSNVIRMNNWKKLIDAYDAGRQKSRES